MPPSLNVTPFQSSLLAAPQMPSAAAKRNPFLVLPQGAAKAQIQFGVDTTLFSQTELERMARLRDRITLSDSDYYRLQDTLDHDRFDLRTLYRDPYEYYWLVELDFDPNRNKTPTSADEYQQVDDFASDTRS